MPAKGSHQIEEAKKKIGLIHKGKTISQETRNRMRLSHIGQQSWLGKKHSEETKKKISFSTIKKLSLPEIRQKLVIARSKRALPMKDTKIEIKIQNFLKQLSISFFTHQYIKQINHAYQCDILIPAMNMVIECDGNYWHKYPIGNELDHIRTKELIEKGFKVLRIWEAEINEMNIEEFKNKINLEEKQ